MPPPQKAAPPALASQPVRLTDPACPSVLALVMAEQNPPMWTPQFPLCVDTCGACQVLCGQTLSLLLGEHSGVGPLGFTGGAGLPRKKPQTRFCIHSACTRGTRGGSVKNGDLPLLSPQRTLSPGPVCSQPQTATQHAPSGLYSLGKETASVKCVNA